MYMVSITKKCKMLTVPLKKFFYMILLCCCERQEKIN